MSNNWKYVSGDWNAICDSCGKKLKASELRRRWDGFMVCEDDYEMRHPQDFIRAKKDKISVPWTRPISDILLPYLQGFLESTRYSDTYTHLFAKVLSDTHTRSDTVIKAVSKLISDTTTINESITFVWNEAVSESISTNDSISYIFVSGSTVDGSPVNSLSLG